MSFLNLSGLMAYSARPLTQTEILQRFQNRYLRISNDTLYHDLNVVYVRDEIKRLGQRYADRRKHSNILATNLMKEMKTVPIEKKITSRFMYLIVL